MKFAKVIQERLCGCYFLLARSRWEQLETGPLDLGNVTRHSKYQDVSKHQ